MTRNTESPKKRGERHSVPREALYLKSMRRHILVLMVVVLLAPGISAAQALGDLQSITGSAFTLSVSPQYPAPFSQATVSTLSDALDLTNATLTASVAGKEIYKGAVRTFSVDLGKVGSITAVKVTVTAGGVSSSQTLSIQPQDVVLIAEPLSSAPPLYQGKPFVPLGGDVRVVAVADLRDASGKTSSPASYSYAWTVDGARVADSSGIGKSSIAVASPLPYRAREVSVAVKSAGGNLVGGASFSLTAQKPSARIYENDPLLGIRYERALIGSFSLSGAEATLYAAPFSLPTKNGAPAVQWFLNGAPAQTGNSITLRPTGSGRGSASLSFTASSGGAETAIANLFLSFGEKSSTNFFGL